MVWTQELHTSMKFDCLGEKSPERDCSWWLTFQHPEWKSSSESSDSEVILSGSHLQGQVTLKLSRVEVIFRVKWLWSHPEWKSSSGSSDSEVILSGSHLQGQVTLKSSWVEVIFRVKWLWSHPAWKSSSESSDSEVILSGSNPQGEGLWRWLPLRMLKRQSPQPVLLRTPSPGWSNSIEVCWLCPQRIMQTNMGLPLIPLNSYFCVCNSVSWLSVLGVLSVNLSLGWFSNRTGTSDDVRRVRWIVWVLFYFDHVWLFVLRASSLIDVPVLLGSLSMQRFWATGGKRKCAVFLFNLSSHYHFYFVKYRFTSRDD